MPIKVKCVCGADYEVPQEWAGRTGLCKRCKSPIAIPAANGADVYEVVEDEFDVVNEEKSSKRSAEPKDAPRKMGKKRRIDPEVRRLRDEEREAHRQHRRTTHLRGWAYLTSGILLIVLGIGLIWVCLTLQAGGDPDLDKLEGIILFLYKIGGAWVPGIVMIVAGLAPLILGTLNLIGIPILVAAWEEDEDDV